MTMSTPPHFDDETLSALLDGDAAPDVAQHVRECDACSRRVGWLGAAADLVAAPVTPPDGERRDTAIAAALAAAGDDVGAAPVTSLAARRRRWLGPVIAAAAVIVALLVAVPVLTGLGGNGGGRNETASRAKSNADRAAEGTD